MRRAGSSSTGIAPALAMQLVGCGGGTSAPVAPPPIPAVQALQVTDVQNIVTTAVNSVNAEMVVAVVDRAGFVLGVFRTHNAPPPTTTNSHRFRTQTTWLWPWHGQEHFSATIRRLSLRERCGSSAGFIFLLAW